MWIILSILKLSYIYDDDTILNVFGISKVSIQLPPPPVCVIFSTLSHFSNGKNCSKVCNCVQLFVANFISISKVCKIIKFYVKKFINCAFCAKTVKKVSNIYISVSPKFPPIFSRGDLRCLEILCFLKYRYGFAPLWDPFEILPTSLLTEAVICLK